MEWFQHKVYNGKRIPYRLSKAIIKRDNGICQYCGKVAHYVYDNGLIIQAFECDIICGFPRTFPFEIDHIKPKCLGGQTHYENLKLLCRMCNRSKAGRFDEVVSAQHRLA